MYKPKPKQEDDVSKQKLRLPPTQLMPVIKELRAMFEEAQAKRGSIVEQPWSQGPMRYMLMVQWEKSADFPVWTLYEESGSASNMLFSQAFPPSDLDFMYEMLCLHTSNTQQTTQGFIPEELRPKADAPPVEEPKNKDSDIWKVPGAESAQAAQPAQAPVPEHTPPQPQHGQIPPGYGQQMPGMPGQPMPGMPGQPMPGMPGQPMPGMPGQPMPGMPGQPMPGMPGQPMPGMPGQPMPGMPGQAMPGMPGQPMPGMPGQPMPGMPGAPGYPYQQMPPQPMPGYPGQPGYPQQQYPPGQPGQWTGAGAPPPGPQAQPAAPHPASPEQFGQKSTSLPLDMSLISQSSEVVLGELLINSGLVPMQSFEAALKMTELVKERIISSEEATTVLQRHHSKGAKIENFIESTLHSGAASQEQSGWGAAADEPAHPAGAHAQAGAQPQPSSGGRDPNLVRAAIELLVKAGVITNDDVETANQVRRKHGGDLFAILSAAGKVDQHTVDAAFVCQILIQDGSMKVEQCIIALNYCSRMRVSFDDALEGMGWPNPRKR